MYAERKNLFRFLCKYLFEAFYDIFALSSCMNVSD